MCTGLPISINLIDTHDHRTSPNAVSLDLLFSYIPAPGQQARTHPAHQSRSLYDAERTLLCTRIWLAAYYAYILSRCAYFVYYRLFYFLHAYLSVFIVLFFLCLNVPSVPSVNYMYIY